LLHETAVADLPAFEQTNLNNSHVIRHCLRHEQASPCLLIIYFKSTNKHR